MKARRILPVLAALLVFLASAPSAGAYGIGAPASPRVGAATPESAPEPQRDAGPKLRGHPVFHRVSVVASGAARRLGEVEGRLFIVDHVDAWLGDPGAVARIDAEAGARLLRASNTPCCVRGPPATA